MHSKSEKLLVHATLRLVTAYVALPLDPNSLSADFCLSLQSTNALCYKYKVA